VTLLLLLVSALGSSLDASSRPSAEPNLDIFVVNADGSGRRNLTKSPAWDAQPAISPDGRTLAFVRNRTALAVMASDGSRRRSLIQLTKVNSPTWSRDGARIAFDTCYRTCEVGIVRRDGSGLVSIPNGASPRWDPTRNRLAYATTSETTGIAVVNADGSGQRLVVRASDLDSLFLEQPVWSPQGSKLAFRGDPCCPLYSVKVDSASPPRLLAPNGHDATWSPNGKRLALTGGHRLLFVRADGSGLRPIRGTGGTHSPAWSPDGTRLAYIDPVGNERRLVVLDLNRHSARIVARGAAVSRAVWSPDGRKLYYAGFIKAR